ncbi:MAG: alpha-amylase family glycosyl hydrolase [Rhodothermaceae bacterium]
MGLVYNKIKSEFSIFAPQAERVVLCIFENVSDDIFRSFDLEKEKPDLWKVCIEENLLDKFYAYKIIPGKSEVPFDSLPFILDPYADCVCTYTTYKNPRRAKIVESDYNWKTKSFSPPKAEDLIIYETHLRDLTIDPSAKAKAPGTYSGFVEKKSVGGLNYIKSLGVNAVEFLPLMEYGYMELPYNQENSTIKNTWNPYERNHWGYMTANFFSPSAYYSLTDKKLPKEKWIGDSARQINDFKNVVDELHSNNIAVIMDVVYNHLSEYETGNLKEISRDYYFRTNDQGYLLSDSFCGNDLKSENFYVRKLILDSLIFWMKEYQIDGFRFDLGNIIDDETLKLIVDETRKINPDVVLIAEPWGGGYAPTKFSDFGFASWNDKFRNGIKGENPQFGLGWIFGKWYGNNNFHSIQNYITGTIVDSHNGLFNEHFHSVNYLEAHDGYTLSDFIRLALKDTFENEKIYDIDSHTKLSDKQLKINKLAALILFVSKGITMIHSGQEFARSKVIYDNPEIEDENVGQLDHNSYEKDNPTNWINFDHAAINSELLDYYKGLISFRNKFPEIKSSAKEAYTFYNIAYTKLAFGFEISSAKRNLFVVLNADPTLTAHFDLPEGNWKKLITPQEAGEISQGVINKKLSVAPTSGYVLLSLK